MTVKELEDEDKQSAQQLTHQSHQLTKQFDEKVNALSKSLGLRDPFNQRGNNNRQMQINNQQPDPAARNRGKLVQACNLRLDFSFRLTKPNGMDTACNELPRIQEEYTAVTNQKAAPRSNEFR